MAKYLFYKIILSFFNFLEILLYIFVFNDTILFLKIKIYLNTFYTIFFNLL